MIRKTFGIAALLVVVAMGTAQAQDYPPVNNSLVASVSSGTPGTNVLYTARTFQIGTTVRFVFNSTPVELGTAVANSNGIAQLTAPIPSVETGAHRVDATGTGSNGQPLTVSTNIQVTGTGTAIPRTGSNDSLPMATIGVSAVAVGGLLLLLANRRRTPATTG